MELVTQGIATMHHSAYIGEGNKRKDILRYVVFINFIGGILSYSRFYFFSSAFPSRGQGKGELKKERNTKHSASRESAHAFKTVEIPTVFTHI